MPSFIQNGKSTFNNNVTVSSGNLFIDSGDLNINNGNLTTQIGNITTASVANLVISNNITSSNKNLLISNSDLSIDTGTLIIENGALIIKNGDVKINSRTAILYVNNVQSSSSSFNINSNLIVNGTFINAYSISTSIYTINYNIPSNYVNQFDIYEINTRNNTVTIILPLITSLDTYQYKRIFRFVDVGGIASTNNIIINVSSGNSFNATSPSSLIINTNYATVELISDGNSIWFISK